jgi:hypothetical protein
MQPLLVVSLVADGVLLGAWLKTAKFQSITPLSRSRKGGTASERCGTLSKATERRFSDAEEVSAERAAFLLASFIQHYGIGVLNVAGPRQSQAPHTHAYAHAVINLLLQDHKEPKK